MPQEKLGELRRLDPKRTRRTVEPYFARRGVIASDAVRCPTCTRIADADDLYCSKCGTALAIQSDPHERTKIDFERFFELAVDVFVVTGPDARFELVNQALARLLGVDREVVRGINADELRQALAAGLSHYALQTGCQLIAEGVESQAEADMLLRLGIEFAQGYLYGRPEPISRP